LGFSINPANPDVTLQRFEHHDPVIGQNRTSPAIEIYIIVPDMIHKP